MGLRLGVRVRTVLVSVAIVLRLVMFLIITVGWHLLFLLICLALAVASTGYNRVEKIFMTVNKILRDFIDLALMALPLKPRNLTVVQQG